MSTLYITVGLPGSGKTEWANASGLDVVSSDQVREMIFGDVERQSSEAHVYQRFGRNVFDGKTTEERKRLLRQLSNQIIFETAYDMATKALDAGEDVVFDATNLSNWERRRILRGVHGYSRAVAVVFKVPFDECVRRQYQRGRVVPIHTMNAMQKRFEYPKLKEGFHGIIEI